MPVLRLFAAAREAAGTASVEVAGVTVDEVLVAARARFGPELGAIIDASKVWRNGEPASGSDPVGPGDEVAVLPPVSGGSGPERPPGGRSRRPTFAPAEPPPPAGPAPAPRRSPSAEAARVRRVEDEDRAADRAAGRRPAPSGPDRPVRPSPRREAAPPGRRIRPAPGRPGPGSPDPGVVARPGGRSAGGADGRGATPGEGRSGRRAAPDGSRSGRGAGPDGGRSGRSSGRGPSDGDRSGRGAGSDGSRAGRGASDGGRSAGGPGAGGRGAAARSGRGAGAGESPSGRRAAGARGRSAAGRDADIVGRSARPDGRRPGPAGRPDPSIRRRDGLPAAGPDDTAAVGSVGDTGRPDLAKRRVVAPTPPPLAPGVLTRTTAPTGSITVRGKERKVSGVRERRTTLGRRYAVVYDTDGPKVTLGVLWFVAVMAGVAAGWWVLTFLFAIAAGWAAMEAADRWRERGVAADPWVAALGAGAVAGAGAAGAGYVGAAILLVVLAAVARMAMSPMGRDHVLSAAGNTVGCAIPFGLASASVVLANDLEIGAVVALLLFASAYDAGDHLIGSGSSNSVEGPLTGIVTIGVVAMAIAVLGIPPFEGIPAYTFAVFAAVLCPLGQMAASAILPANDAHAPSVRRLDSLLLLAPVWVWSVGIFMGSR